MKKASRMMALLLALVLVFSLAACKSKDEPTSTTAANRTQTEAPATNAPATDAPATEAPASEAPATEPAAESKSPDTEAPTAPATEAPTEPATEAPTEPATEEPTEPGEEIDPAALVGTYKANLSIETLMGVATGQSGTDSEEAALFAELFKGAGDMIMYLQFQEDGKLAGAVDQDSMQALVDTMLQNLPKVLPSAMGMTEQEFTDYLATQNMTMDDFIASVSDQLDPSEILDADALNVSGTYRLEGNKLFVTQEGETENRDNYLVISLEGDNLVVTSIHGSEDFDGMDQILPWTFVRVDDDVISRPVDQPDDGDSAILGKYVSYIPMDTIMELSGQTEGMDEENAQLVTALLEGTDGIGFVMDFTANNTMTFSVDEKSLQKMVDVMLQNMLTVFPALMDMTSEEFSQFLKDANMTEEDFIAAMAEEIDTEEMFGELVEKSVTTTYVLEDGKIYIEKAGSDNYMEVELGDDTLTIVDIHGADMEDYETFSVLLPWTFEKTDK